MSSDPNKAQSGRMNSITRRLRAAWMRKSLFRIVISTLLLFALACLGWMGVQEYRALGFLKWNIGRSFFVERTVGGRITELYYRIVNAGEDPVEIAAGRAFTVICIAFAALLILRLFWLFVFSGPRESRRIRTILAPLNDLALKADELSRMEFGEDKYHVIEDAISQLDADESSRLSLGDSDLAGIEAAINNLLVRIRESNMQQARFVNDASHELRTPIAVISGYADMLARWGKNDEKVLNEAIAAIQTESGRMKHLVEQLLFLARGDSGKTTLTLEDVSLTSMMREAYEESVMIDEKHVYRFSEPENDTVIKADTGLLKQAVRILLDNAAKYTKEGDEIILSCGEDDGHPYLQVQDCGIGMAEDNVAHMFERFYRADEARSFVGTGLGLSIAKWIVDKHKGHFEILSRPDIGTRIRIVL
jgi:signal transduction histidine kinase